jgi:DNA primase
MGEPRIEEVVGDFVHLKKSGSSYKALSPFSSEKTPSFYVSPAKGIFKDFSSGKGGNSVTFLMEHEQMSYPEALRYLAKKYNITIEEDEVTPEQKEEQNKRESLYIVNEFAQQWFVNQLLEQEGRAVGLAYFKERGFNQETIETFHLGYSPDSWDSFTNAAKDAGYGEEYLLDTGLIKQSGERRYDAYRGRVIFPIHNLSGRPIGFGARTLKTDKKVPKYINSPESDVYFKSKIVYGIYQAKGAIVKEDNCLLVEGYTDVLALHQAGIKEVVASSGTALTKDQVKLIKRYTNNITILYDGDPAGIKASFRGIDLVLEEGMHVKVVLFPEGEDPDSFSKKLPADELKTYITKNAKDFIRFKTSVLIDDVGDDPMRRSDLIHEIVNSIALIPDHIARSIYTKECSNLLDISERALISELNKARKKFIDSKQKERQREKEREKSGTPTSGLGNRFSPRSTPPLSTPPSVPPPTIDAGVPNAQLPPIAPPPGLEGTGVSMPMEAPPLSIDHEELAPEEVQEDIPSLHDASFQERDVIRIMLNYGNEEIAVQVEHEDESEVAEEEVVTNVATLIAHDLLNDKVDFQNPLFAQIFDFFVERLENDEEVEANDLVQHHDPAIQQLVAELLTEKYKLDDWERKEIYVTTELMKLKKAVHGALFAFKTKYITRLIDQNQLDVKTAVSFDDVRALLEEQKKLQKLKTQISKLQGITILK